MCFMPAARPWPARRAPAVRVGAACLLAGGVFAALLPGTAAAAPVSASIAAPSAGPTVKQVVEFTRLVQPRDSDANALQTQISPDGRQAFIVTRTADVAKGRTLFRIELLDLDPQRLQAGRPSTPRTLLTVADADDVSWLDPAIQDVRWFGLHTLLLRGRLKGGVTQGYRLEVTAGHLTALTHAPTPVISFAVSDDFKQVVYVAQIPKPPLAPGARSVVVANQSFWAVKFGQTVLAAQDRQYRYFASSGHARSPVRPLGPVFAERSSYAPGVSVSPDGRWALLPRYAPDRQLAWAAQYPLIAALMEHGASLSVDPLSYFSRPRSFVVRTLVAHRLADGFEQVVVDAPDDAYPGRAQTRSDRLWQNGGTSVVIAGTHLPLDSGQGNASQLIEYWPDTSRLAPIAPLAGRLEAAYAMPGPHDAFVAIDDTRRRVFDRAADGQWQERDTEPLASAASSNPPRHWALQLEQALNVPPQLWAIGPTGQRVQLTQLNPAYTAEQWGTASAYTWRDAKGRQWDGGVLLPSKPMSAGPRPLVIQTYGFAPERFYLDGSNIADGVSSGFAGRAFLREGLVVLALPVGPSTDKPTDERGRIDAFADGVRSVVSALVAQGLVDPDRVGLMGWSATGERTLNLMTFTDIPIRAATILDGDANTMFSLAITYGAADTILTRKEATNGGGAFGPSLQGWLRYDPALHTDCVRAALRIETYSPVVLNNWDIYALLRRQYKPVEMIVLPGGSHSLAHPGDRMVSLQGNVDWFRFWLQDAERREPVLTGETPQSLQDQYGRWRQMAQLRQADALKPPCTRLLANRASDGLDR